MNVAILRDAYLEAHGLEDDGMRVDELEPLNEPLETLKPAALRPMARELEISLNPTREENVARLLALLELGEEHRRSAGQGPERRHLAHGAQREET